jgi:hypothetical protein
MEGPRRITQHLGHRRPFPTRDSKEQPLEYRSEGVPFSQLAPLGPPRMKYQHNGDSYTRRTSESVGPVLHRWILC